MDNSVAKMNIRSGTLVTEEYLNSVLADLKNELLSAIGEIKKPEEPEVEEPEVEEPEVEEPEVEEPEVEEPESEKTPCGGGPRLERIIELKKNSILFEFWGMDTKRMYVKITRSTGEFIQGSEITVTSARVTLPLDKPLSRGGYTLSIRPLNCTYKETSLPFFIDAESNEEGGCNGCDMTIGKITVI